MSLPILHTFAPPHHLYSLLASAEVLFHSPGFPPGMPLPTFQDTISKLSSCNPTTYLTSPHSDPEGEMDVLKQMPPPRLYISIAWNPYLEYSECERFSVLLHWLSLLSWKWKWLVLPVWPSVST